MFQLVIKILRKSKTLPTKTQLKGPEAASSCHQLMKTPVEVSKDSERNQAKKTETHI